MEIDRRRNGLVISIPYPKCVRLHLSLNKSKTLTRDNGIHGFAKPCAQPKLADEYPLLWIRFVFHCMYSYDFGMISFQLNV